MATNTNDLINVDVILGQVPSGGLSSGGYNAPTGMEITNTGTLLNVSAGFVLADSFLYRLKEDYTKDIKELFDVGGDGKGCLCYGESFGDGKWYVFAVNNKYSTDIFISKVKNPIWPADTPIPPDVPADEFYSGPAYKFCAGYNIGYFVVEDGIVKDTYPKKDMASSFLDKDFVYQDEFTSYQGKVASKFTQLDYALATEASTRSAQDAALNTRVDETNALLESTATAIRSELDAEATAIRGELSDEADARLDADTALGRALDAEAQTRAAEDASIRADYEADLAEAVAEWNSLLAAETTARTDKDSSLDDDISGLDTRLTTAEGTIVTHETHLSTLDTTTANHTSHLSSLDTLVEDNDQAAVHKAGAETVTGTKTFTTGLHTTQIIPQSTDTTLVPNTMWVNTKVSTLNQDLTTSINTVNTTLSTSIDNLSTEVNDRIDDVEDTLDATETGLISKIDTQDDAISARVAQTFNAVSYNPSTGIITFTRDNASSINVDLPMELLIRDGYYDPATKEIVLILANDTPEHPSVIRVDVEDLIDTYTAKEGGYLEVDNNQFGIAPASFDQAVTANSTKLVKSGAVHAAIADAISAEVTARNAAIAASASSSSAAINQEVLDRIAAVEAETANRTSADADLDRRVAALEALLSGNVVTWQANNN